MNDKLEKTGNGSVPTTTRRIGMPALHSRIASAPPPPDPSTARYRLGIMCDDSGSMSGIDGHPTDQKIKCLRDALEHFVMSCDFSETAIAVAEFNRRADAPYQLSMLAPIVLAEVQKLGPVGGTPIGGTMTRVLAELPITRGILLSDGHPTDGEAYLEAAQAWAEAEIVIDTVHIGTTDSGAAVLQSIAKITGGKYIKFDNLSNFAANFKFLAPAFRGMLESGNAAELLGAKEVK